MTTKIFALGDSWFHYPKGLDRNGNVVLFPNNEKISKGRGIGNIPLYLNQKFQVDITYNETTWSQLADPTDHTTTSHDDDLGVCGAELNLLVTGAERHARPGTKVESPTWLDQLVARIDHYDQSLSLDRAIVLLSGGGNDIVGTNLKDFVQTNLVNGKPALDTAAFDAIIETFKAQYNGIFTRLVDRFPHITFHFLLHGYDYPPVNNRGLINHDAFVIERPLQRLHIGPWLQPTFETIYNGQPINRDHCQEVVDSMIDRFNDMLETLAHPRAVIHHINLRNTADRNNRDVCWANELHYDRDRFILGAQKFYGVISDIFRGAFAAKEAAVFAGRLAMPVGPM